MPVGLIAAGVGAVGSIGGALISSNATKKASKAATDANAANNAVQTQIYGQNKDVLSPYIQTGYGANNALSGLLGIGGAANSNTPNALAPTAGSGDPYQQAFQNYMNSTGYQFRVNEGQKALNTGYAAKGLINSGAAQKAALDYGQNIASGEFGNYINQLQGQQQVGLSASNALAGVGTNYANATSANNNAAASNVGNAALVGANNTNSLFTNLAGIAGNVLGQSSYGGSGYNAYGIQGSGGIY